MMRRFSARMFPNSATIFAVVQTQDKAGGRVKAWPVGVTLPCSVQLADPARRGDYQGATRSEVDGVVYFADDPGVKVDDRLTWHVRPGLDRVFSVLGPATPEAGQDALHAVPLKEVK